MNIQRGIHKAEDLQALTDLYFSSFKDKIRGNEVEVRKIVQEEVETCCNHERSKHFSFIAYENQTPIGFLFAAPCIPNSYATMFFRLALQVVNATTEAEEIKGKAAFEHLVRESLSYDDPFHIKEAEFNPRGLCFASTPVNRKLSEVVILKRATAVSPGYQNKGVGYALNQALQEVIGDSPADLVTLCTDSSQILSLNTKLGYLPLASMRPWYSDGSGVTLMMKAHDF